MASSDEQTSGKNQSVADKRLFARRLVKISVRMLLVLMVFGILIAIFHNQILLAIGSFMTVRDPVERSDVILLMNRESQTVPFAAAELYRKGYAPKLVLGGYRSTRIEQLRVIDQQRRFGQKLLTSQGVPPDRIEVIGMELKDTIDLGGALGDYCKANNIISVIVVTSSPFSRLDRNDLSRRLADQNIKLRMYPVRTQYYDETDWWNSKQGWIGYFDAYYLSVLHYCFR